MRRKRSVKSFVFSEFIDAINQLSWLDIYLCQDPNTAVKLLSDKITSVLDIMAPMRTIQIRTNYNPWLSLKTKEMMTDRDRLHKTASETQKPEEWRKFKDLMNKINNRLKSEEKDWQRKKLNDCEDDSEKLWKNLKNILN